MNFRETNQFFALVFTFGLAAAWATDGRAGSLDEDCDDIGTNDPFLCATAADFGTTAAFLRETLDTISGPSGLRRSGKDGTGREWFGLVAAGAQSTSGNFEGNAGVLVFGADTEVSSTTSLGIMAFLESGETTPPGSPTVEREGVLIGPYFATRLGDGAVLNGHLLYGQPDFTVNNVASSGETLVVGLTYSRNIERPGLDYGPFVSLSAKREEPGNGDRIDAQILTIGTSLNGDVVETSNGFRQFFGRVEFDAGRYSDTFGTEISYVAPRLTGGARFAFDDGGALQVLANVSAASDDTTIVAGQVSYRLEF